MTDESTAPAKESHLAVSVLPLGGHPQSVVASIGWAQFDPYNTDPTPNVGQASLNWQEQPKRIISQTAIQDLLRANGLVRSSLIHDSAPLTKVVAMIREMRDKFDVDTVWMYRSDVMAFDSLLGELDIAHPLDGLQLMDPPTAFRSISLATGAPMPVRDDERMEPQYSVIGDIAWLVRAVKTMYNPAVSDSPPTKGV